MDSDPLNEFRRLIQGLLDAGETYASIAAASGVTHTTISRPMKGDYDRSVPSSRTFEKIRRAFPEKAKQDVDDPAFIAEVATRIRKVRKVVAGAASDETLARSFGITAEALNLILSGASAPSLFGLRVIAGRLRVTTDFLLYGRLDGLSPLVIHRLLEEFPELAAGTQDTQPGTDRDRA